jgi:hypothetical protein
MNLGGGSPAFRARKGGSSGIPDFSMRVMMNQMIMAQAPQNTNHCNSINQRHGPDIPDSFLTPVANVVFILLRKDDSGKLS